MSALARPDVHGFFDEASNTVSYLVADPGTRRAAVIDPVLDYDQATGAASVHSADAVLKAANEAGLKIEWVLETHAHADHLSAAPYIKLKTGAKVGIGEHIRKVQQIFRPVFNAPTSPATAANSTTCSPRASVHHRRPRSVEVIYTPGHTPACVSYRIGDAVFIGDTLFMPDYGTARADFPGGDARPSIARSTSSWRCRPRRGSSSATTTSRPGATTSLGDDDRGRAAEPPHRGQERGRVRRHAGGAGLQIGRAAASSSLNSNEYSRRQAPASGPQRRVLLQDSGEALDLSFTGSDSLRTECYTAAAADIAV